MRPPYFVTPRAYFENLGYKFADDAAFIAWFTGSVDAAGEYAQAAAEAVGAAGRAAEAAETEHEKAAARALDAEAWATGTRGGEDVPEEDPAYEKSAAYYAGQMQQTAQQVAARQEAIEGELAEQNLAIRQVEARTAVGTIAAASFDAMTDHSKIYVLTKDVTGGNKGSSHYWDEDGGAWTELAKETDTELELAGVPADAREAGRIRKNLEVARESIKFSQGVFVFERGYRLTTAAQTLDYGIPGELTWSENWVCAMGDVAPGDVVIMRVKGTTGGNRAYAFLDANGLVLTRAEPNIMIDGPVVVPDGAEKIIINNNLADNLKYFAYTGTSGESVRQRLLGLETRTNAISDAISDYGQVQVEATATKYWNAQTDIAILSDTPNHSAYTPIQLTTGQKYKVQIKEIESEKSYPILLVDDDYNIIRRIGGHSNEVSDLEFVVAEGETMALLTCKTAYRSITNVKVQKLINIGLQSEGTFAYNGSKVVIIGDSISTNGSLTTENPHGNAVEIVVEPEDVGAELSAYVTAYDVGTVIGGHEITSEDVGTELAFTPSAEDVGKKIGIPKNNNIESTVTWWEVAQEVLGFEAIPVCWSGSSITSHEAEVVEDGAKILATSYAWHPSQIRKCGVRIPGSMERIAPDMVIIFRGANDLTHSPFSRITDYMDGYPTAYPDADTFDDNGVTRWDFAKGLRMTIKAIRDAYPHTRIVLCTLSYFRRITTTGQWTTNGTDTWQKYNAEIRRIAQHEGCDLIEFDRAGLTWANAKYGYYNEGTSDTAKWTHPNTKGQKALGNRAVKDLLRINGIE